jgi:RHS repeat-associated protein
MVLVAVVGLVSAIAFSQAATGTPPFGSFAGGPDVINLANLNVHWDFPIISKPGRGLPFNYALRFDNSVWKVGGLNGQNAWEPVNSTFGWIRQTEAFGGYMTYFTQPAQIYQGGQWITCGTTYSGWAYHEANGTAHPLDPHLWVVSYSCTTLYYAYNHEATVSLDDGSGYVITINGNPGATVHSPSGESISPPLQNPSGPAQIADANGNYIITNDGVSYWDTLGSNVMTGTNSGVAYPQSYTYQGPNGPQTTYVVYTSYTVQTNFGCAGTAEYGPVAQVPLLTNIYYPDGSSYQISYEQTPGYPDSVTGRLASVTLPTGGTISYSYWGGEGAYNGIFCDGTTAAIGRNVDDGSTVAQKTFWIVKNADGTTSTDARTYTPWPAFDETIVNFTGGLETQRTIYQGPASGGTLLETVETCYNGASQPCVSQTSVDSPITRRTVYPKTNQREAMHDYFLNSYGLATEVDDYDWTATGTFAPPLRKTLTAYATNLGAIVDRPASVTVEDGNNNILAQTTYSYDEFTNWDTSGYNPPVPNHGSPPQTQRGNLTTVNQWVSGSTYLTKHFFYNDTGTLSLDYDVNGEHTTYNFPTSDPNNTSCSYAFPTSVSLPAANGITLTISNTYNCTGAVAASTTDANGQTRSINAWDVLWRPTQTQDELGNVTNISYTHATASSAAAVESMFTFNGGNSVIDSRISLNGLGRRFIVQRKQSPTSANYDSTETDYDYYGRPWRTSMPYVAGAGAGFPAGTPVTTTSYDALSRPTLVTDAGGGTVNYSYVEIDTLVSAGPAPSGESAKYRQYEHDALGRLTSVCELTSGTGYGTCGQVQGYSGYFTQYGYDAAGRLLRVTQNAQAAAGSQQTRSFMYDGLGRMTWEYQPETAYTHRLYDSDPNGVCSTTAGDLVRREDQNGNVTCYSYDTLHRPTSVTYPSGPNAAATAGKNFIYDAFTWTDTSNVQHVMQNAKGRMAVAYTCTANPCNWNTWQLFNYSVRGEVVDTWEARPHADGVYHLTADYWPHGALKDWTMPGVPTITYGGTIDGTVGLDGEGRITKVSAGSGQNPVTGVTYYNSGSAQPIGALTQVNFGSSDHDQFSYDVHTGRMLQYQFYVNSNYRLGNLTWNGNGSLGSMTDYDGLGVNAMLSCSYGYDDLARLQNANCSTNNYLASGWQQNFSYDPFGNITKTVPQGGTGTAFQVSYNQNTNQINYAGYSYDNDGNLTADASGSHTYQWDAEGHPTVIDGSNLTYDAFGRMVEEVLPGDPTCYFSSCTQTVYGPDGSKLAVMSRQNLLRAFVPLPGGATAVYNSNGLQYYRHADWLGSSRLASTPSRTMYSSTSYAPFGENYNGAGTTDLSFTGQNQDTVPGLYDFMFRRYSPNQGRWISPDPAGLAAVDPMDPQSWNRYAYVTNRPLTSIDPLGLDCIYLNDSGEGVAEIDHNSNQNECWNGNGGGGYWVDGNVADASWVQIDVNSGLIDAVSNINGFLGESVAGSNADGGIAFTQGPFALNEISVYDVAQEARVIDDNMSPAAHDQLVAIHDALAKIPVPCGLTATASIGEEKKDMGFTVNSSKKRMLSIEGDAPVPRPETIFEFKAPEIKIGLQVFGKDWHHVTGVGVIAHPLDLGGATGRVNVGSMDACDIQ